MPLRNALAPAAFLLLLPGAALADEPAATPLRDTAMLEYDAGHYANALAQLRRAAEAHEHGCAEILALMYRLGHVLYDGQVAADAAEAAHWADVAASERRADAQATRTADAADR